MKKGPYDEKTHTLHVMEGRCETCIFHPGNRMQLQPGRVADMVREAKGNDSVIPCHTTIHGQRDQQAVCRGYFDAHGQDIAAIRAAIALDIIRYDEVGTKEES